MRAHVDIWAAPDGEEHNVDAGAVLDALRAVPAVIQADRFYTGEDLVAIVEASSNVEFEEALAQIGAVRDCTISNIRLVRST